jgi:peptidoglycan/LPS O-acetylase OafA/YrhL
VITYKHFYPESLSLMFTHFSFLNYFDSLAIGCAAAGLWASQRPLIQNQLEKRAPLAVVIALLLLLVPYSFAYAHVPGRVNVFFSNSFQSFGFAILLLHSINRPKQFCYRWLNWPWIQRIGVLSYSIYIWQQLFCTPPELFGMKPVWWMSFPGWLIAVLVVASISYYGFERPLLKLRARFRDAKYKEGRG